MVLPIKSLILLAGVAGLEQSNDVKLWDTFSAKIGPAKSA
jgi:hypothetical protein